MSLPQFITRRGERLYYRRAYPKDLWHITGKAPFARALMTSDPEAALRARPALERQYQAAVDAARSELARRYETRSLNESDAHRLAVGWFREAVEAWSPEPKDEGDLERRVELEAEAEQDAKEAVALNRDDPTAVGGLDDARALAVRLREAEGLLPGAAADAALVKLLRRAAVAVHQVRLGRLSGDYGTHPTDPLFASALESSEAPASPAPTAATPTPAAGKTVEELETAFKSARLSQLSAASVQAYVPVFRLLREVVGATTPLASLNHDHGQRLFEAVQGIPANAQKAASLRGLSLVEQIAEGRRQGLPTLSAKTINDRYMASLGALFRFARQRGWMNANPVEGFRAREEVAAVDRREPFGAERLAVLLGSDPWAGDDKTGGGKPIRYWGPLLALFHGLRLGEVAGLLIKDIGEEGGQPLIHVRAGERQLKTRSARRDIPLHPELVRLGFLAFLKERGEVAGPDALLFEGESAYARQQWGRGLGDWFARKVRALGLEGRKLTFHSLRHDFRDALREAEVGERLADYLMGHAQEGMGSQYGARRPPLARLKAAIEAVGFDEPEKQTVR